MTAPQTENELPERPLTEFEKKVLLDQWNEVTGGKNVVILSSQPQTEREEE